jgi:hypothetical protein
MCTICATLLADLFLYSYEADFVQGFLKKKQKNLARSFNFTFRYIDDVLPLTNSRLGDFVDRIYSIDLEIKDTTDAYRYASYLDLHLKIDSEERLRPNIYDNRQYFNFPFGTFHICSNIPCSTIIWSLYLSVNTIFQSLWFISGFP